LTRAVQLHTSSLGLVANTTKKPAPGRKMAYDVPASARKLPRNVRQALLRMPREKMYYYLEILASIQDNLTGKHKLAALPKSSPMPVGGQSFGSRVSMSPDLVSSGIGARNGIEKSFSKQESVKQDLSPASDQTSPSISILGSVFSFPFASDNVREYVDFCGNRVPLSSADKAVIADSVCIVDYGSLSLIGFRHREAVPLHFSLERALLVYPNEEMVTGSTVAFGQLHGSMMRKNVVGFGELVNPKATSSRIVSIFPVVAENERPPGLILNVLPCEEEIREFGTDALLDSKDEIDQYVTDDVVSAAMRLIKKQTIAEVEIGEDLVNVSQKRMRFGRFIVQNTDHVIVVQCFRLI
jgi:hypothetical protein